MIGHKIKEREKNRKGRHSMRKEPYLSHYLLLKADVLMAENGHLIPNQDRVKVL